MRAILKRNNFFSKDMHVYVIGGLMNSIALFSCGKIVAFDHLEKVDQGEDQH